MSILLLLISVLSAQPTGLHVVGVPLPTQAVISYTAPSATYCTVEVSHSSSYSPLIHDVNGSLFSNADRDLSRSTTVVNGLYRQVVIGAKTSDAASGVFYSRALFTERAHYVRVTCDGNSATMQFVTPAPPVGDLYSEVPPFNAAAWGNHAWPTIDPTSQTAEYADPMTGVALRLATVSGQYVRHDQATVKFESYTGGTGWTNPANILEHSATVYAQTGNTNSIVVYPDARADDGAAPIPAPHGGAGMFQRTWGSRAPGTTIDDFGVFAYAEASLSGADAQFGICRTLDDGVSCFGNEITVTAAVDGASPLVYHNTSGKLTPNYPTPFWSDWGGRGIPIEYMPVHGWPFASGASLTVTAGVAVVSNGDASANFPDTVGAGTKIFIAGSSPTCTRNICTVASWDSPTQVTLSETGLTISAAEYYTLSFGIRIRKINANGTLSISVGFRSHGSTAYSNAAAINRYNLLGFTSGDGKPGRLCTVNTATGASALMFCADDGTMRLVSIGRTTSGANDAPSTVNETHISGFTTWHPSNPKKFYAITKTNLNYPGHNALYEVTYSGDASTPHVTDCGPNGGCIYVDDGLTWVNLTPPSTGNHLRAMAEAACPAAYTDHIPLYGNWDDNASTSSPGSGKYAILHLTYGSQDGGPAWYLVIDVTGPTIVKCHHTFSGDSTLNNSDGSRWSTHHAFVGLEYPEGTFLFSSNALKANRGDLVHSGPFETTWTHLMRSGSPSTDTSLPWPEDSTYDRACPSDIDQRFKDSGAVGNVCATLRGKMPCWLNAGAAEREAFPCSWSLGNGSMPQLLIPGDNIVDASPSLDPQYAAEHMKLVKVTLISGVAPSGDYEFVFHRDSTSDHCSARHGENNASRNTHPNGWKAWVAVRGPYSCDGGFLLWRPETGDVAEIGKYIGTGHTGLGRSVDSNDPNRLSFVTTSPGSIRDATLPGLQAYPPNIILYRLAGFNEPPHTGGFTGSHNAGLYIQSYMKRTAVLSDSIPWAVDGGAISPNQGGANEDGVSTVGTRAITLQGSTTQVYKIGLIGTFRNIKHSPLLGWAGRYLLQEKSSPITVSHTITDSDSYKFCFAYKAGECRTGSSANDIYVSLPKSSLSTTALIGQSYKNVPVVVSGFPIANWSFRRGMKQEVNGDGIQRLTQALGTASGHYSYFQTVTDPKGIWALNNASSWRQGEHLHALLTKLPTYERDSVNRSVYQQIPISVPALSGATHARIRFGRNQSYECTPRAEACVTDGSESPFAFITSDAPAAPTSCGSGCTINMPAATGIYYYRIEWMSGGSVVSTGAMTVLPVL
jgi:hypothetical protein